jgi:predicted PurR-regulated permease PerM
MQPSQKVTVSISNKTIVRSILWVAAAVLLFHSIGRISHVLTLIFMSFFLALALNPAVAWMSHRLKIESRVRASAAAYLTIVILIGGFFALITPPLVHQTRDFINDAPAIAANFQTQDSGPARLARRYSVDSRLSDAAHDFASHYSNFGSTVLDTTKRVGGVIVSTLAVIVMTFMMLVEGPRWFELSLGALPKSKRPRHRMLAIKMYQVVSGFVLAQVILAAIAASFCLIALLVASNLLNVSINAVALAGIVALFGLIPMIGNPLSSVIIILVCLLNSVNLAIVMLIYFLVYYQIESLTIQPYVQARKNELTPLLVFISALIGISLGGIIGALAAIPVAGCIKILLEDRFQERLNK